MGIPGARVAGVKAEVGDQMSEMEILECDGVETLYVQKAIVSTLVGFLNPQIPWVWVLGHMPNRCVEWWQAALPLNKQGVSVTAELRSVRYDLMLPTAQFIELAAELDDHGLVLIQSRQRMPDTLDLSRIPDHQQDKVLRGKGAFLRMYLPHAIETAEVQCFEKGYLGLTAAEWSPSEIPVTDSSTSRNCRKWR